MAKLNLDTILKNKKISQQQLSEGTGINKSTINRYCNNSFEKLDMTHLDTICSFLNITPNELFEFQNYSVFDFLTLSEVLEENEGCTLNKQILITKRYLNHLNSKLSYFINLQKSTLDTINVITLKIKEVSEELIELKQQPINLNDVAQQIIIYLKDDVLIKQYKNNIEELYINITQEKDINVDYILFKDSFSQLIIDGYINMDTLDFVKKHNELHPYLKLYFEELYLMFIEEYWEYITHKKD